MFTCKVKTTNFASTVKKAKISAEEAMLNGVLQPQYITYRNIPFEVLVGKLTQITDKDEDNSKLIPSAKKTSILYVMCGYVKDLDAFVFLKYDNITNDKNIRDKLCPICLEPIAPAPHEHSNDPNAVPIRIYGDRCFHDMHAHCLAECKKRNISVGMCCPKSSMNTVLHLQVVAISLSKVIIDDTLEYGAVWSDIEDIAPVSSLPNLAFAQITKLFKRKFVPYGTINFTHTIESFDPIWKARTEVLQKVKPHCINSCSRVNRVAPY